MIIKLTLAKWMNQQIVNWNNGEIVAGGKNRF